MIYFQILIIDNGKQFLCLLNKNMYSMKYIVLYYFFLIFLLFLITFSFSLLSSFLFLEKSFESSIIAISFSFKELEIIN